MKRSTTIKLASLAAFVGLIAYSCTRPAPDEVRYRIAVEFDTPDGIRSGSSIIQVQRLKTAPINYLFPRFQEWKLRGEAVFVDLGRGRNAVMLLTHQARRNGNTGGMHELWRYAYELTDGGRDPWTERLPTGLRVLRRNSVPTIITFTDLSTSASAKVIYARDYEVPCGPPPVNENTGRPGPAYCDIDEIAATLGPNYAFRRATLELVPTKTPVSSGLARQLPFLATDRELSRGGSRLITDPYEPQLDHFIKE